MALSATWDVLTTPAKLAEGLLWGGWFASSVIDLVDLFSSRVTPSPKDEKEAKKVQGIWETRSSLFFGQCAVLSAGSMFLSWLDAVQIFPLGRLLVFTDLLGYGGSAMLSARRLVYEIIGLFYLSALPKEKSFFIGYLNRLIKVAFNATLVAWSALHMCVLGGAKNLISKATLDLLLIKAVVLCVIHCVIFMFNHKQEILTSCEKTAPKHLA